MKSYQLSDVVGHEYDSLLPLLNRFKEFQQEAPRQYYFIRIKSELVANIKSAFGLRVTFDLLKDPSFQKALVTAIGGEKVRELIDKPLHFDHCLAAAHEAYRREFALQVIGIEKLVFYVSQESEGKAFRLLVGEQNQVERITKDIGKQYANKLMPNVICFLEKLNFIQQSERLAFIKHYIGMERFIELIDENYAWLKSTLETLPLTERFNFMMNDLGIDQLKLIIKNASEGDEIRSVLPGEHGRAFQDVFLTEENKVAREKLAAIRDEIEKSGFVTLLGQFNQAIRGGEQVTISDGSQKIVSFTAARILESIEQDKYTWDFLSTLRSIQQRATFAMDYSDRVSLPYQQGVVGSLMRFGVWATRTDAAQVLYERIARDQIGLVAPIQQMKG
jgi:hypothetical protein